MSRRDFSILFILLLSLASCSRKQEAIFPHPPITPAWALGQIVWEDEFNTQESAIRMVDGYLQREIPVSGLIIDSPWATSYNDFQWDPARYPVPQEMLDYFRGKDVHTLFLLTGCMNHSESARKMRFHPPGYHPVERVG